MSRQFIDFFVDNSANLKKPFLLLYMDDITPKPPTIDPNFGWKGERIFKTEIPLIDCW